MASSSGWDDVARWALGATLRLFFAAREVTIPLALAIFIRQRFQVDVIYLTVALACLIGCILLVFDRTRPATVWAILGWPTRVRIRLRFARWAESQGWVRGGERPQLVRIRTPRARQVEVTIKPRDDIDETKYHVLVDDLVTTMGYEEKVVLPSARRKHVRARFTKDKLPLHVPWRPRPELPVGVYDLGQRADGRRLRWDTNFAPHLKVLGATGMGKTALASNLIHRTLEMGGLVVIWDPKMDGKLAVFNELDAVTMIDDPEDGGHPWYDSVETILNIQLGRQLDIQAGLVDSWTDHPKYEAGLWRPILVWVDEYNDIARLNVSRPTGEYKMVGRAGDRHEEEIFEKVKLNDLVMRGPAKGRTAGVFWVLAGQSAPATVWPSELQNNLRGIVCCSAEKEVRDHAFGPSAVAADPDVHRILDRRHPGAAVIRSTSGDVEGSDLFGAQLAYASAPDMVADLKANDHPWTEIKPDYRMTTVSLDPEDDW